MGKVLIATIIFMNLLFGLEGQVFRGHNATSYFTPSNKLSYKKIIIKSQSGVFKRVPSHIHEMHFISFYKLTSIKI